MTPKTSLTSPRLVRLQQDLQTGQVQALDLFWQDIGKQGTPLIETIPGDEAHRLVTFFWKDSGETHNIVIIRGPTRWGDFARNQMVHLLGTNVWYKTYQVRSDMRTTYQLSLNDSLIPLEEVEDWNTRTATFQADPLNPHRYIFPQDEDAPESKASAVSVLELPHAPAQPWMSLRANVAQGNVEMHRFHSALLNNTRRVWVYTPPEYTRKHEPYELLLLFDGFAYLRAIPTPTILDNLLHEHKLPPLVAVLFDSLDQETRSRELSCSPLLVEALTRELLPWIHEQYHVTTDPAQINNLQRQSSIAFKFTSSALSESTRASNDFLVELDGKINAILQQGGFFASLPMPHDPLGSIEPVSHLFHAFAPAFIDFLL